MKKYSKSELDTIIAEHGKWLAMDGGGRADLRGADLRGASLINSNLCSADLSGASLINSDLRGANLRSVRGNRQHIKSLQCDMWDVSYTATHMQIGCQRHTINEWWSFTDAEIDRMDRLAALSWWSVWKPLLQQIISAAPALDTGSKS